MILYRFQNTHLILASLRLVGRLQQVLVIEGLVVGDALLIELGIKLLLVDAGRHLCWILNVDVQVRNKRQAMKRGVKQAASRLKYDAISYAVTTPLPTPLSTSATMVSTSGCWGDNALSARGIPTNPHEQCTRCPPLHEMPTVSLRGPKD
jgi:hypothetical protein